MLTKKPRHGNRLDAADQQWHLSSPTPYDPPLTYGGWLQTRALGARIAAILRERIQADEAQQPDPSASRRRRKYKIILHSSPFLRCIQTSIAIAAGIAQDPAPLQSSRSSELNKQAPKQSSSRGPRTRPTVFTDFGRSGPPNSDSPKLHETRKSVLRLDAFLGEWLSPSYFDLITPPPGSVMMLASAKADLLRREAYESYPTFNTAHTHSTSHGQLWAAGPRANPGSAGTGGPSGGLENMATMSSSLPKNGSMASQANTQGGALVPRPTSPGGYTAPAPNFGISSNSTIPLGYVAHARDGCVDIDYQWDSMRGPLEWGDGGTFGEEWASMHHRFRKGIQNLVDWYAVVENPTDMVTKTARNAIDDLGADAESAVEGDEEDEDTEAVVIMVTHGAGCNALIGAITHQPVLTEVAMASLTMAVRKPHADVSTAAMDTEGDADDEADEVTGKVAIHQEYDLKLFANTEHLRSAAPTPTTSRSSSVAAALGSITTRGRFSNSFSSSLNPFSFADGSGSRPSSTSEASSRLRRPSQASPSMPRAVWSSSPPQGGITVGSGVTSFANNNSSFGLSRTPSIGLWSPIVPRNDSEAIQDDEDEDDDMLLNFSHEKIHPPAQTPAPAAARVGSTNNFTTPVRNGRHDEPASATPSPAKLPIATPDKPDAVSQPGLGIGGLWGGGGPKSPAEAERMRSLTSTKRRWTVDERAWEGSKS